MLYKVIFDTEPLFNDDKNPLDEIFHKNLLNVKSFLDENKVKDVELCITEMTLEERIQQKKEIAEKAVNQTNENLSNLSVIGYPKKGLKAKNYDSIFRKLAKDFINKNSILVLKTPRIDPKDIINRAIRKIKPFNDKKSGFKDTIILYSLIKDAEKEKRAAKYIFVSNNKRDFTNDVVLEFFSLTKKKLIVVDDVESLKAHLDKVLTLRLELKNLHEEIKEEIKKKVGTLISELNKTVKQEKNSLFPSATVSLGFTSSVFHTASDVLYPASNPKEISGYDYSGINIENISKLKNGFFEIQGTLTARAIFNQSNDYSQSILSWHNNTERLELFNFRLIYNQTSKSMSGISFNKKNYY